MKGVKFGFLGLLFLCLLLSASVSCLPSVGESPRTTSVHSQPIIGGKEDFRYPEVGALLSNGSSFCTGTLIAKRVVLTAGHCVDAALENPKATIEFRIDIPDANESKGFKPNLFLFDMALFKNHPQWTGSLSNGGDIGVGILKQPVTIARPMAVNFNPDSSIWARSSPLFLGYGLLQSTPTRIGADRKYGAEIPIIQVLADRFTHQAVGKSVCHGDSGGPALVFLDGKVRVIGVNSYVTAAGVPGTDRSSCTGSGTSMRTDSLATFIQAILSTYGDGPEVCDKDSECGNCRLCGSKKLCEAQAIQTEASVCKACTSDQDCLGGGCYRFSEGSRCLRRCDSKDCCPEGQYCSTLQTKAGLLKLCMPFEGACPPLPCRASKDCGAGEFCEAGFCLPSPVARKAGLCRACTTPDDCKDTGGTCLGLEGHRFCSQPCSTGDFCPSGYACREPYPGLSRQCLPVDGSCFLPCAFDSQCPQGQTCQDGVCAEPQGGGYGSSCDPAPCQEPFLCAPTISGRRCLAPCGISSGKPGSACIDGTSCDPPFSCFTLNADRQICLQACQTDGDCQKVTGGYCFQGVCACQTSADCKPDAVCNHNSGVIGACAPAQTDLKCSADTVCEAFAGESYCIKKTPGQRALGQPCDALNRCREGMVCIRTQEGSFCVEDCSQTQTCRWGGNCSRPNTPTDICFCAEDSECGEGRFCRRVFRPFGFCQGKGIENPCKTDGDCPPLFGCRGGKCLSPAELEVWREPPPPDASEPSPEPSRPDASEATPEPEPPTEKASPEPQKEASPPEKAPDPPPPPILGGGCSCQSAELQSDPESLLLLGLFFLSWLGVGFFRRGGSQ